MKYAICNEVYGDMPFDEACQHAAQCGYTGMEIAPFTLGENASQIDPSKRKMVRESVSRNGMEVVGLHWLLAGTSRLHMTSPNAKVRKATYEYFRSLIELCHDLGGTIMVLGSPNERSLPEEVSQEDGFRYAADIIGDLSADLEKAHITLAIEPLGPEETNFITTAQSAVRLIDAISSPFVKLHLDVKAMSTESSPIADTITKHANHLVHFHANDPNRQGPGTGNVEFEPIIAALKDIDYDGWLSVEVFDYSPGLERLVAGSIDYLESCIDGRE